MTTPEDLEAQFVQWRLYVQRRKELQPSDADELEDHLRASVDELTALGLRPDEAFLVAVKRMGSLDELSREFAREHSDRLWKQLVLTGDATTPVERTRGRRDLLVMVGCAAGAALSVKARHCSASASSSTARSTPRTSASSRCRGSPRS